MDLLPSRREEPLRVCSLVLGLLLAAQPVGQGASADPISEAPAPRSKASHAAALRAKALELGYNLDHEQALETFKESIAADPDDPAGYRLAAATIWVTVLFEQGVITVEDYLGQARADVARATPRPELAASFTTIFSAHGRSANAGSVNIRVTPTRTFRSAPRSDSTRPTPPPSKAASSQASAPRAAPIAEHGRVLELEPRAQGRRPHRRDVPLRGREVSGLSRLFAFLAGFRGDRDPACAWWRRPRVTRARSGRTRSSRLSSSTTARPLRRRAGCDRELQARYPRNRLLWLEAGGTALRAKRPGEARERLEAGLAQLAHDPRPKAPGEEARWRYTYGAALVALKDSQPAERELQAALNGATRDWLRGRIHRELGKLADLCRRSAARARRVRAGHPPLPAGQGLDVRGRSQSAHEDAVSLGGTPWPASAPPLVITLLAAVFAAAFTFSAGARRRAAGGRTRHARGVVRRRI